MEDIPPPKEDTLPPKEDGPTEDTPPPKKRRIALKVALVVVGLVILFVATLPLWISDVARSTIEKEATAALGVETTLEEFSLSLFRGEAEMSALQIDNPEGYVDPFFMKMGHGFVAVTIPSLMKDRIVIPEIVLEDLEIHLESRVLGGSNVETILDHLGESSGPEEEAPADTAEMAFVIEHVRLRNIKVKTRVDIGVKPALAAEIKEIHLENVGSESQEDAIRVVTRKVIRGLLAGVLKSGVKLPGAIAKGLGKGLKGAGKVTVHVVGDAVGGVGDAIGGLFGGKKKKEKDE